MGPIAKYLLKMVGIATGTFAIGAMSVNPITGLLMAAVVLTFWLYRENNYPSELMIKCGCGSTVLDPVRILDTYEEYGEVLCMSCEQKTSTTEINYD